MSRKNCKIFISFKYAKIMDQSNDFIMEPPSHFDLNHIFEVDFHPNADLLACCLVTGEVKMFKILS